jgi:hypothetical protein
VWFSSALSGTFEYQALTQPQPAQRLANSRLSAAEEQALFHYMKLLGRINLSVCQFFIHDVANFKLQCQCEDGIMFEPVESNWVSRVIKRT